MIDTNLNKCSSISSEKKVSPISSHYCSPISSHKCSPISSHYCSSISSEKKSHRSHQKKSLINLIIKINLTNLIGALGSMAATSRSENQAVAQLWFHVIDVWVFMRFGSTFGFKRSTLVIIWVNIKTNMSKL